jgi:hypothetical protein
VRTLNRLRLQPIPFLPPRWLRPNRSAALDRRPCRRMTDERRPDLSAIRRLRSRACSASTVLTTSTAYSRLRHQFDPGFFSKLRSANFPRGWLTTRPGDSFRRSDLTIGVISDGRYGEAVPSPALPAPCHRRPRQGRSSVADPPTELDELLPMVSEQPRIGSAARIRVDAPQPVVGRNVAADQILQRATTGWVQGMQDNPGDGVRPARAEPSRNHRPTGDRTQFANPGQVILPDASVETTNRPARA